MATRFNIVSFVARWLFAIVLVFGTYNPTGYSYVGWLFDEGTRFGPVVAIVGLLLLVGWIVYLRATFLSMGWLGIVLGGALLGCVVWLFVDIGWISLQGDGVLAWVVLTIVSLLLAMGMSWSHVRRRLSGQVDVDDVEDGVG